MKIPGKQPIQTIIKKLPKLNSDQQKSISDEVNSPSTRNLVSLNTNEILYKKNDKTFSVKFINYIEPYLIKGQRYTLFYTDVNHNLKVGDRVFIVGGNYDSDFLIQNNKFSKLSDGYTVQYVDKTKVVLDIEFTGILPWNEEDIDFFVKVYVASSQEEFEYFIQTFSSEGFDYITNRFASSGTYSNNNLLYINGTFSLSGLDYGIFGFTNSGSYSLTYSNSFLILNGTVSGYLQDITSDILIGSYSNYVNRDKLIIVNDDFVNQIQFKKDYVYKYDDNWIVDREYLQPFISEQNFRDGVFRKGEFNQGLLGTHQRTIDYSGEDVKFTLGTVLNVNWNRGDIGEEIINERSFFTEFNEFGLPSIKESSSNNDGLGYNFIYDSNIKNSNIENGTFYNNKIGEFSTSILLENYLLSNNSTYSVNINSGDYINSIIENSNIKNASLFTSLIKNSFIDNSKSINSEFERSVFFESRYTTDKIVKIESYDEIFINWYENNSIVTYKMYKFYINVDSYKRLKHFNNFYIDGINIKDSINVLNFFDDKYSIDSYQSSYDEITGKQLRKKIVQLSTVEENKKIPSGLNNELVDNPKYGLASIDIIVNPYINFNNEIAPLPLDIYSFDFSGVDYSTLSGGASYSFAFYYFDTSDPLSTFNSIITGITSSQGLYDELLIPSGAPSLNWPPPGSWTFSTDIFTVVSSSFSYVFSLSAITDLNDTQSATEISAIQSFGQTVSQIGDIIDISSAYILDSDFKSGLFKSSEWITGNNIAYNIDNSINSNNGFYLSTLNTNRNLLLSTPINRRKSLSGLDDIVFLNGMYYDTTLTGGDNLVKLNSAYKIVNLSIGSNRTFTLEDFINGTSSVLYNVPTYNSQSVLTTKNAKNAYNYLHSVKFESSKIKSGIFRRIYFENCDISNNLFDLKDRDPINFNNWRSLLLSDILFSDNNNKISSGLVINSSFMSGSDTWNNGIFYNSVWNTDTFTWSNSATGSTINTTNLNKFKNGILKESTWLNGVFENGNFYKNRSNITFTQSVYSNLEDAYYFEKNSDGEGKTRYSWINGVFENGTFEKSNFEFGEFKKGEFYNSTFLDGFATGGDFGRRNIKFNLTRVASGTFSNVNVISADFRAENPTGLISGDIQINWLNGIFNNGVFGTKVDSASYSLSGLSYSFISTWHDGIFNKGEFRDTAIWKSGEFNGGKFISYYGYPFVKSSDYASATSSSFAWQDGEFNGGEFGNASTGTNSTWFRGEFNGGLFRGRYWNDGIFTKGKFIGSGTSSTSLSNIPYFVTGFSENFFGLWNNGFVSENKDDFSKDKKSFSKEERSIQRKRRQKTVEIENVYWRSGTFSHNDGALINSVWADGTFRKGNFRKSSFNPYINYLVNGEFKISQNPEIVGGTLDFWNKEYSDILNGEEIGATLIQISDPNSDFSNQLSFFGTSSVTKIHQSSGLIIGEQYKLRLILNSNNNNEIRFGDFTDPFRNRNFTEGYQNWIIAATSQSGGNLPILDIVTGSPGYATFSDSTATGSAYIIYPNIFEVGRQYDIKFYSFNVSNMGSIQIGSCDSSQVQIENGVLLSSFTDGVNLTYSSPALLGSATNFESSRQITAEYTDFILNWNTSSANSSFSINGFIISGNDVLTGSEINSQTTYNYTFNAQGPDFAIEFIPKTIASSEGASWIGSTSSIKSIEVVKGDSGFNTSDSCIWDSGVLEDSEFYFSKWNNGKWISGTAMGMIWRNGVADYMNAYNIYWEGGVWRNGNWNGAPFTVENISTDACLFTYINQNISSISSPWDGIGTSLIGSTISIAQVGDGFTMSVEELSSTWDYRDTELDPSGSGNYVNNYGLPFVIVNSTTALTIGNNYRITLNIGTVSIANFDDSELSNTPGSIQFSIGKPGAINQSWGTVSGPLGGSIFPPFVNIADGEPSISQYYDLVDLFEGEIPSGPITGTPSYVITGGTLTETLTAADDGRLYIHLNLYGVYEFYVDSVIIEEEICNEVPAVNQGFASDILTNVAIYRESVSQDDYRDIFINNAFTLSNVESLVPDTPDLSINSMTYSGTGISSWSFNNTYKYSNSLPCNRWSKPIDITDTNFTTNSIFNSSKLYAVTNTGAINIFTQSGTYEISISFLCTFGLTSSITLDNKNTDVRIFIGYSNNVVGNGGFIHNESVPVIVKPSANCAAPVNQYWGQSQIITRNFTFEPLGFADITAGLTAESFRFSVQMLGSSDNGTRLVVTSLNIRRVSSNYDNIYNNATYSMMLQSPSYSDVLVLPEVDFIGGSLNGNNISIHFGNGIFTSGTASSNSSIWENGVWNEGFRYDKNVVAFDDLAIFSGTGKPLSYSGAINRKSSKIGNIPSLEDRNLTQILSSSNNWIIAISKTFGFVEYENQIVNQFDNNINYFFKIGDRVAVSNVVCIDLNGKRRLIKDYFQVIDIIDDILYLQVPINFPIRRIERDSIEHLIFVTKNIWLNGAFLNGIFKGVWNNGLFKGRPYLTKMIDSHWINGRFDGGRFRGLTMSVYDAEIGSENVDQLVYPSSVIQHFDFKDNNVGFSDSVTLENYLKYNSWIELNYFTSSMTNIYRDSISWDETLKTNKALLNYNGYPTKDVLSSLSNFKNTHDDERRDYSLGWKYEVYDDFIENPFFNYPINSTQSFTTGLFESDVDGLTESFEMGATYSIPGLYRFTKNNKWRTSILTPGDSGSLHIINSSNNSTFSQVLSSPVLTGNTEINNIDRLRIVTSATNSKPFLLENDNTKNILKFRYSIIEFEMNHQPENNNFKYPYLLNEPVAKFFPYNSDPADDLVEYISAVPDFIGHNQTNEIIKREYFYNKPSLQMVMAQTLNFYDITEANRLSFTANTGLTASDILYVSKRDISQNPQINGFYEVEDVDFDSTFGWRVKIGPFTPSYQFTPTGTDGGIAFLLKPYTNDFKYIKMYEVDSIPFFYYAGEDRINQAIQAPFSAIAPPIDYSDTDFSLIDSINITETIFDTSNDPVVVSSGGISTIIGSGTQQQSTITGISNDIVIVGGGQSSGSSGGSTPPPVLPIGSGR